MHAFEMNMPMKSTWQIDWTRVLSSSRWCSFMAIKLETTFDFSFRLLLLSSNGAFVFFCSFTSRELEFRRMREWKRIGIADLATIILKNFIVCQSLAVWIYSLVQQAAGTITRTSTHHVDISYRTPKKHLPIINSLDHPIRMRNVTHTAQHNTAETIKKRK